MLRFGILFTKYTNCLCAGLLFIGPAFALTEITQEGEVKIDVKPSKEHEEKRKKREEKIRRLEEKQTAKTEAKGQKAPATKTETIREKAPATKADALAPKVESAGQTNSGTKSNDLAEKKESEVKPDIYRVDYDIRPLKGKLDHIPVLNSNSPEIVPDSGILLSTLDPQQMKHPEAHLNYPVKGPFAIFFHHINIINQSV